jgi:hypothetical protein
MATEFKLGRIFNYNILSEKIKENSSAGLPYKSYCALLTQSGTEPISVTELSNNLGLTIDASDYLAQGDFRLTFGSNGSVFSGIPDFNNDNPSNMGYYFTISIGNFIDRNTQNELAGFSCTTLSNSHELGVRSYGSLRFPTSNTSLQNGILSNTLLEIRAYPVI